MCVFTQLSPLTSFGDAVRVSSHRYQRLRSSLDQHEENVHRIHWFRPPLHLWSICPVQVINNNVYCSCLCTVVILDPAGFCPSLRSQLFYAVVAHTCASRSSSIRASSLISSRREYRLGGLLWLNSLSSLESLGPLAAFSWACWYASSARRTTSWTSRLRPWEQGCWGSALRWGLLLVTSSFRLSAWQVVEWTEIRTCGEQRIINIPQNYQWNR